MASHEEHIDLLNISQNTITSSTRKNSSGTSTSACSIYISSGIILALLLVGSIIIMLTNKLSAPEASVTATELSTKLTSSHQEESKSLCSIVIYHQNGTSESANPHSYYCSGAWLGQRHIVTAAHCVSRISLEHFYVLPLGEGCGKYNGTIVNITIHPNFNSTFKYDIAVIELTTLDTSGNFNPQITLDDCMYDNGIEENTVMELISIIPNNNGTCSDSPGNGTVIKTITMLNNKECSYCLNTTLLDGAQIYCGRSTEGPCKGDSGSPLMHKGKAIAYNIGGCINCPGELYSVYINYRFHADWIRSFYNDN